jgi:hypothetical protein
VVKTFPILPHIRQQAVAKRCCHTYARTSWPRGIDTHMSAGRGQEVLPYECQQVVVSQCSYTYDSRSWSITNGYYILPDSGYCDLFAKEYSVFLFTRDNEYKKAV